MKGKVFKKFILICYNFLFRGKGIKVLFGLFEYKIFVNIVIFLFFKNLLS